jgi:hypothetical protein
MPAKNTRNPERTGSRKAAGSGFAAAGTLSACEEYNSLAKHSVHLAAARCPLQGESAKPLGGPGRRIRERKYEHKGMDCYRFHFGPRHMYLRLWGWAITEAVSNACTILNANLTHLSRTNGDKDTFAFTWF